MSSELHFSLPAALAVGFILRETPVWRHDADTGIDYPDRPVRWLDVAGWHACICMDGVLVADRPETRAALDARGVPYEYY